MKQRSNTSAAAGPSHSARQPAPFFGSGPGRGEGSRPFFGAAGGSAHFQVNRVSPAPQPLVQRQPAPQTTAQTPQATPQATNIPDADRALWVQRVDDAVRAKFGLTGAGMNLTRVRFVDSATFGAAFPAASIEQKLLELFLAGASSVINSILRHHRMAIAVTLGQMAIPRLQRFIRDRIAIGNFEEAHVDPRTGQMVVQPITPRDLLAMHIGGVTDVGPAVRGSRRILMQVPADVETLVHEACHFYVHNSFKNLASTVPNRGNLQIGVGIEHTLMEGFAEAFTRQVMRDNAAVFGPLTTNAYQTQVEQVWRYMTTIGQADAVAAYFHGNAGAINRLRSTLAKYETTHPDLLEPWP